MLAAVAAILMISTPADWQRWGEETLQRIRSDFYLPEQHLYAEEATPNGPGDRASFNWPAGVMLSALNAGASQSPKFIPWLRDYADHLRAYWQEPRGFDVYLTPKPADRYYDDNAWMALALIQTAKVLRDPKYLDWAEKTVAFILTGEDRRLGGGIYWREQEKISKNTCANAPTALACAQLYARTGKPAYLKDAVRIYRWTKRTLEDPESHLFWDHIKLDGSIEKTTWSYNTALMIRSALALEAATGNAEFKRDASLWRDAAVKRWLRKDGALDDDMAFAHLLFEALCASGDRSATVALDVLHERARDAQGRYGRRWSDFPSQPLGRFRLIDQASAARAYFDGAITFRKKAPG